MVMRPITLSLCLLLVLGMLSAFTVEEFLAAGEEQTNSEQFTAFGATYEIISIDGTETFLLKNGDVLDNQGEIEAALYQYYISKYYPSDAEIQEISDLLALYHESRENGDMWKGIEEEECRMGLFLHAFPCTNSSIPTTYEESKDNDCYLTASVLCDEYGEYLGCSDPIMIMPLIQDFALSSNELTRIEEETTAELANISEGNIYLVFTHIKENIEIMEECEEKLESTQLRVPYTQGGDKCNTCYGICPPIIIEEQYLEEVEEKIDALLPDLQYIGEYDEVAKGIYQETIDREKQKNLNEQQKKYLADLKSREERANMLLQDAESLLEHVSDPTVNSNYERAKALVGIIETEINETDFTTIDADFDEFDAKLNVLEQALAADWKIYNDTVAAKERADGLFFTLETKSLSEEATAELTVLKAEKRTQDRSFVDGLSPEKYQQITDAYEGLSARATSLMESTQQVEVVVDTFKGAGTKTNEGISGLASTMAPLEREDREEIAGYAPLVVSSLSFFSISSLAIFVFLFVFATLSNVFRNKIALFLGLLLIGCTILFAGVISGSIYVVLTSASIDASFTDFQSYVFGSDHVSILVETEGVPSGASAKMLECADKLAASFPGKDVVVYERTNSECIVRGQGITLAECYNTIEEPIIAFQYNSVEQSTQFSTGFVYKGTFTGDEEYFNACQLATGFTPTNAAPASQEEPQAQETE